MNRQTPSAIDPTRYLGTVTRVNASSIVLNLPRATARPQARGLAKGAVGDFVFIDSAQFRILGRITETRLPDAERLQVEPTLGLSTDPDPIGHVQLLASLPQNTDELVRGVPEFPRIGDGVYGADPEHLAQLIGGHNEQNVDSVLPIGTIDAGVKVDIYLSPEKLFGRHCGVFGTTGGGKSWTLASMIEQLKEAGGKAILFDPTGEFSASPTIDRKLAFSDPSDDQTLVHFPYRKATEDDLFSLFRPSGQSQGPKLRQAIKSLKLLSALGEEVPNGIETRDSRVIVKANQRRRPYNDAIEAHRAVVHASTCEFAITDLSEQLRQECVWDTGRNGPNTFGGPNDSTLSYCEPLISRINTIVHSAELQPLFGSEGTAFDREVEDFLADADQSTMAVSFKNVRFEHNTREILLNVVGRFLLSLARQRRFHDAPLVVFLDEAHQFLGRVVGDEYASLRLDAFGLIAKEGRKYGLTCVLATQRPRDVPQDVMSQLGTLVVHRLINDDDRRTVERACGELDRGAAEFLPTLGPGEAIVLGPDLPAPLPIKIHPPVNPPDSEGPKFSRSWSVNRQAR